MVCGGPAGLLVRLFLFTLAEVSHDSPLEIVVEKVHCLHDGQKVGDKQYTKQKLDNQFGSGGFDDVDELL